MSLTPRLVIYGGLALVFLAGGAVAGLSQIWSLRSPTGDNDATGEQALADVAPVIVTKEMKQTRLRDQRTGWPRLFGPYGDNTSSEKGIRCAWPDEGPPLLWQVPVGRGYSAPVVQGERLIVHHRVADQEIVLCLHPATGEEQWKFAYPTTYECRFGYSNGPYATPVIDGDRIFALGAQAKLHCLSLASGKVLWKRDLSADYQLEEGLFGAGASPLVLGDRLILNLGGKQPAAGIIALDKATGATLWTATDDGASYATPAAATIHSRPFLFVFTDRALVALNPEQGDVYWRVEFRSKVPDNPNATSPLVYEDKVLVAVCGVGALCLQVLPDGHYRQLWQGRPRDSIDSQFNTLLCLGGFLYGFSSSRADGATFRCLELASGELRWKHRSNLARGQALAADGHFIILGEYGHLASLEIDPNAPRPLSMTCDALLQAPCYTAPALHQGRLYLRNEQVLLCLDVRQADHPRPAALTGSAADTRER